VIFRVAKSRCYEAGFMLPSPPVIGQQKTLLYHRSKFEFIKDFDLEGVVGNFTAQLVVTCHQTNISIAQNFYDIKLLSQQLIQICLVWRRLADLCEYPIPKYENL
jgi:hypothetical protein